MNFAVGIACLMVVAVLGEVAGTHDKQLSIKDQRKIKDQSSVFLKEDLEEDLNNLERAAKNLKKKKTKLYCKIAGGQCEHKKKDCHGGYGHCIKGKEYCTHSAFYCCCVPPPPKGCVFDDVSYPDKAFLSDTCFKMKCLDGEWNIIADIINKNCTEHCSLEPIDGIDYITNFDGDKYQFKQTGTFTFVKQNSDSDSIDNYGLEVYNGECIVHNATYPCVKKITYYDHDLTITISPAFPEADYVTVNDQNITMENGTSRTFNGIGCSVLVYKECPHVFYLTSSKGLSVRIAREHSTIDGDDPLTTLDVWTRPPTPDQGLCALNLRRSEDHLLAGRSLPKSNEMVKKRARLESK